MGQVKIGVFGHYGNSNLGDESIILSVLQNLKKRLPDAEFIGLSLNPENSKNRFAMESYPIRNQSSGQHRLNFINSIDHFLLYKLINKPARELLFLKKSFQVLKSIDLLLVCGSNQFIDTFGGVRGYPYTLTKWTFLAKMRGIKVVYASVGAGPILNNNTYRMLKPALKKADHISYRDSGSKRMIESRIENVRGSICPDLAHGLTIKPKSVRKNQEKIVVGINPMPVFDQRYWYKSEEDKYRDYVDKLSRFAKYLADKGYAVQLFNTHPKDLNVASDIIENLKKMGLEQHQLPKIIKLFSVEDLIDEIANMDIIVATRFHASVLPLRFGIPVLGIGYYRKTDELLTDIGLGEYYVDINNFTTQELESRFDAMVKNMGSLKDTIHSRFQEYHAQLDRQWDLIVDLVND
jgi:polysaccharide pyruvyl transferase WcaK-like protein